MLHRYVLASSLTLTLSQRERERRLGRNPGVCAPRQRGSCVPLIPQAAAAAKQDGADGAYLYQYLVFCAHGLFG
jgi:hypothetical protein